jgi:hypothetical protein
MLTAIRRGSFDMDQPLGLFEITNCSWSRLQAIVCGALRSMRGNYVVEQKGLARSLQAR